MPSNTVLSPKTKNPQKEQLLQKPKNKTNTQKPKINHNFGIAPASKNVTPHNPSPLTHTVTNTPRQC
jgi:hypothetical protein